jgi:hypothetical protein
VTRTGLAPCHQTGAWWAPDGVRVEVRGCFRVFRREFQRHYSFIDSSKIVLGWMCGWMGFCLGVFGATRENDVQSWCVLKTESTEVRGLAVGGFGRISSRIVSELHIILNIGDISHS